MGTMIPYDSMFMKAMDQSRVMDSNVTPPYHPGLYNFGSQPEGNPGRVVAMNTQYNDLNLGAVRNPDTLGGAGGEKRSYIPAQDFRTPLAQEPAPIEQPMPGALNLALVPETTYGNEQQTPAQEPQGNVGNLEEQKAQVEAVANGNGTIEQLLAALKDMASMQPGDQGNPVFQLDAQYKNSDAMTGIPGTVAQYPTAGGMTRETDYNLGASNGGI